MGRGWEEIPFAWARGVIPPCAESSSFPPPYPSLPTVLLCRSTQHSRCCHPESPHVRNKQVLKQILTDAARSRGVVISRPVRAECSASLASRSRLQWTLASCLSQQSAGGPVGR